MTTPPSCQAHPTTTLDREERPDGNGTGVNRSCSSGRSMPAVTSADGTPIGYDVHGCGLSLVLHGSSATSEGWTEAGAHLEEVGGLDILPVLVDPAQHLPRVATPGHQLGALQRDSSPELEHGRDHRRCARGRDGSGARVLLTAGSSQDGVRPTIPTSRRTARPLQRRWPGLPTVCTEPC